MTTSASPEAVAPGKRVSLVVDVAPKPKMHVYSPGQEGYIAHHADARRQTPRSPPAKAKYPAGEKLYMPILNETQLVYAQAVPDRAGRRPFDQAQGAGGALTIKGTLRYQACDDTICYLPTTVPLSGPQVK